MSISKLVMIPSGLFKKPLRLVHESDENRSHVLFFFYTSLCVLADHEQDSYRDIVYILLLSPCFACMIGAFLHNILVVVSDCLLSVMCVVVCLGIEKNSVCWPSAGPRDVKPTVTVTVVLPYSTAVLTLLWSLTPLSQQLHGCCGYLSLLTGR